MALDVKADTILESQLSHLPKQYQQPGKPDLFL